MFPRTRPAGFALAWVSGFWAGAALAQSQPVPAAGGLGAQAGGLSTDAEQMRKRHIEEADKKLRRQTLAAQRALNSLCTGCGERAAKAAVKRRTPKKRSVRPEEAPDFDWVPPADPD